MNTYATRRASHAHNSMAFPSLPHAPPVAFPPGPFSRPHPHLSGLTLYLSHVPPDPAVETFIVAALRDVMPVCIAWTDPINRNHRLKPDQYYDWMPMTGEVTFVVSAEQPTRQTPQERFEKALAILPAQPYFAERGILISPYPPPHLLPPTSSPVPARYLRPLQLIQISEPSQHDPGLTFVAQSPLPAELYDAIRPWGPIRGLSVWAQDEGTGGGAVGAVGAVGLGLAPATGQGQGSLSWGARVEFWYEEDARRFEYGFGETGSVIKGWQVKIASDAVLPQPFGVPFPAALPAQAMRPPVPPPIGPQHGQLHTLPHVLDPSATATNRNMLIFPPLQTTGLMTPPLSGPMAGHVFHNLPPTPPLISYQPPWASHNLFALAAPMTPLTPTFQHNMQLPPHPVLPTSYAPDRQYLRSASGPIGGPLNPLRPDGRQGRSALESRSVGNFRGGSHTRQRTWSVTVENSPEGELRPTGLVADDGTFIQHGPGQHIRPAPAYGPGSASASGLVDYSNVFVKGLDPDINSYFLEDLFRNIGRIISARVMRDESQHSRGYGFVSFHTPAEAARAIDTMNNTKVGRQTISVTLHEPRKLRPEKIAERIATGAPAQFGRQAQPGGRRSSSPARTDRRGRYTVAPEREPPPGTTDEIRSLSPPSRKQALRQRLTLVVKNYARAARVGTMTEDLIEPTVAALVMHDLEIIPILYDRHQLEARIAETIELLREDAIRSRGSARESAGTALELVTRDEKSIGAEGKTDTESVEDETSAVQGPMSSPHLWTTATSVSPSAQSGAQSTPRSRKDVSLVQRIRNEVRRIDPMEVDAVITILLPMLDEGTMLRALENRSFLAGRYNVAKKELIRRQAEKEDVKGVRAERPSRVSQENDDGAGQEISEPSSELEGHDSAAQIELNELDLKTFAALPAKGIVALLASDLGDALLKKIAVARPDAKDAALVGRWSEGVLMKGGPERGTEIANTVAKKLDPSFGKRSAKLKVARELVNAEDDEALCKLLAYPALINAKAKAAARMEMVEST